MLIVQVFVHVLPDHVADFVAASEANAAESRKEPGVVRFDLLREEGTTDRFVLLEIYRTDDDPARHKETAHYAAWKTAVEPWMASPRKSVKYRAVSPSDPAAWRSA
ncbi:MAG: antibiotic biosynthesis monooxygenase [Sandaracinaceae bacterium]|nr:antibiotic biosynthesis monooxygenase [Sandaracinaceae bacterium]